MKLFTASALALATAATVTIVPLVHGDHATPGEHDGDCCEVSSWAPSPMAFIKNAKPPAPGAVTGTLKGMVKFDGEKPEIKPLDITAEKSQGCVAEGEVDKQNREVLIHKDGGLANVVLTIEIKDAEVVVPEEPIVLDQKGCRFDPHILCIPAGATVQFLNSDAVSHNVHTYPKKNSEMNKTIPAGSNVEAKLEKTDQIEIKCDIHPWMKSQLVVTDTPFMAVSAADGNFEIAELPPGEHTVEWWHETLGKGKEKITVAEDGTVSALEIKVTADEKKSGGGRRNKR